MFTLPNTNIPFENINRGASTDGYINKLFSFLEIHLPEFPAFLKKNYPNALNEEDISQGLYIYLQRKKDYNLEEIPYPFEFQLEVPQRVVNSSGQKRRSDLGIRINTRDISMELIFCIEAKRLPTGTVGSEREKEYLFGKFGGVERFKLNKHGLSDEGTLLQKNGMIAYVQEQHFDFWFSTINSWISDATGWSSTEQLVKIYTTTMARLESAHTRIDGSALNLTHFWLEIE